MFQNLSRLDAQRMISYRGKFIAWVTVIDLDLQIEKVKPDIDARLLKVYMCPVNGIRASGKVVQLLVKLQIRSWGFARLLVM